MINHDHDAERAVLGSVLIDNACLPKVQECVTLDQFFVTAHRLVFAAMLRMGERSEPIDLVSLSSTLKTLGQLDSVGGLQSLVGLVTSVATSIHAPHYASIVRDHAIRRSLASAGDQIHAIAEDRADVGEAIRDAETALKAVSDHAPKEGIRDLQSTLNAVYVEIERRNQTKDLITGIPSGIRALDVVTSGFQPTDLVILAARPGVGKAQPMDSKVLMSDGKFKTMAAVKIGDKLASPDGHPSIIEGIFPQGIKQIFKLELSDGRTVEACGDHLWTTHSSRFKGEIVMDTNEIARRISTERYTRRLHLHGIDGSFGMSDDLEIDPWVLGALLGNGSITKQCVSFSSADRESIDKLQSLIPGCKLTMNGQFDHRINGTDIRDRLGRLGLIGTFSETKFIPEQYMRASFDDRVKLIQGLMDTDGSAERRKNGHAIATCSFASEVMANQLRDLCHSIGARCSINPGGSWFAYKGERKEGLTRFRMCMSHSDPKIFFSLSRKKDRMGSVRQADRLTVVSVTPSRTAEAQCIKVSHPKGLYITDGYVATHNSSLAVNIGTNAAKSGKRVVMFSLEMSASQLVLRMIASESGIDIKHLRTGMFGYEDFPRLGVACSKVSGMNFFIDDTSGLYTDVMHSRAKRFHADKPIDLVIVDYLQLMRVREKTGNHEQEVSRISGALKGLAKDLKCPVVALSQLNRSLEKQEDKRPSLAMLRSSGSIEQDADIVLMLYRDPMYNSGNENKDEAEIIIAKHRSGELATIPCRFDGRTTTFRDVNEST